MTSCEPATVRIDTSEFGSCALVQDLLPLYLEGEVSSNSRDTIVEHLARCDRCAAFLAGAQSVRAQLRRDRNERERVIERVAPAQPALESRQAVLSPVAMIVLCALGAFASLIGWFGLQEHVPALLLSGLVIGLSAAGGLVSMAQRQRRMSLPRWIVLLASCMLGSLATVFIVVPGQSAPAIAGMAMLLVALSGIWMTIFQAPSTAAE